MPTPEDAPAARRRSPGWVRALDIRPLHGLALRLRRDVLSGLGSWRQEALYDQVISELEYRRRLALRMAPSLACTCELCLGPFDPYGPAEFPEEGEESAP